MVLLNQGRLITEIGLLALPMTFIIITGGIDLSVGSVVGFISIIVAYCQYFIFPGFLGGLFPSLDAQTTFLGIETSMRKECVKNIFVII